METKPTGKAQAGVPVFYDAAIWPKGIVFESDHNLLLAEVWRTNRLLRLDVYRVQPTILQKVASRHIPSTIFPINTVIKNSGRRHRMVPRHIGKGSLVGYFFD